MLLSTRRAVDDEKPCSKFHILLKGINDFVQIIYLLTDEVNTWYWKSALLLIKNYEFYKNPCMKNFLKCYCKNAMSFVWQNI